MSQPEFKSPDLVSKNSISILFCGSSFSDELLPQLNKSFEVHNENNLDALKTFIDEQSLFTLPDVILIEVDKERKCFEYIKKLKENALLKGLVVVMLSMEKDESIRSAAMKLRVNDLYTTPIPIENLCERIVFLVKFKLIKPQLEDLSKVDLNYKTPAPKRIFDVVASFLFILAISPLLLLVAIIIALESKGPIIFKSKRVGAGYKVFDFYKFRSMRAGASEELKALSGLNQYAATGTETSTFTKLKDDPRITRFGHLIRKFSIDELPQLFNVLKGDMSLVGNRPLPLYEAEMLTSNEWAMRFLGPAGLTGLWQVSRRGKGDMSERERKKLDNFYAKNNSFWLDLKILLYTVPAIVQKEKV